jgi:cytochrome P450
MEGPLARIGTNWVVCSDPAEIRKIAGIRSGWYRSPWYRGMRLDPGRDCILSMEDGQNHHRLRAHLLAGYAGKGIDVEGMLDDQISKFVNLIDTYLVSTEDNFRPLNLAEYVGYFTEDTSSLFGYGKPFGYMDARSDMWGYLHISHDVIPSLASLTALSPLVRSIVQSPLLTPLLPKPTDSHGVGRLLGEIKKLVDERYGPNKIEKADVLQAFIKSGLDRDNVEAETLVQLLGGSGTTATAVPVIILYLISNPPAYRKLQREIDAVVAAGMETSVISDSKAKSMTYLQAVIKEGLRCFPPIPALSPKRTSKPTTLCGKYLPPNTEVSWSAWGMMKNKDIFGPDAHMFNPDRWLTANTEKLKAMDDIQGLVFMSKSRWQCLGKAFAYQELGKLFFEVSLPVNLRPLSRRIMG